MKGLYYRKYPKIPRQEPVEIPAEKGEEVRGRPQYAYTSALEETLRKHENADTEGYAYLSRVPLAKQGVDPAGEGPEARGQEVQGVARLSHGLEKVVEEPGKLFPLVNKGTGKHMFDPWLESIHSPDDIEFDAIPPFVSTSRDQDLHATALAEEGIAFKGSTSSMTSLLAQSYFALSDYKQVESSFLSADYSKRRLYRDFTWGLTHPVALALRPQDGIFAIDSLKIKQDVDNVILLKLGKQLERFLTMDQESFETRLLKAASPPPSSDAETYHYMRAGSMLLRSQLDCWSPSIKGARKTFDLKTRAVRPVRLDCRNYKDHAKYELSSLRGLVDSFEREYWDMMRSAFLKYNFQVRIGNMAGIFLAYHNTAKIFGFEYVPLQDLDAALFGNSYFGSVAFDTSLKIAQTLLKTVAADFGTDTPLALFAHAKSRRRLEFFVVPRPDDPGWSETDSIDPAVIETADITRYTGKISVFRDLEPVHGSLSLIPGQALDTFVSFRRDTTSKPSSIRAAFDTLHDNMVVSEDTKRSQRSTALNLSRRAARRSRPRKHQHRKSPGSKGGRRGGSSVSQSAVTDPVTEQ